ncbi:MAG: hypothetical protein HHJ16_11835 [Polaromonas sp.]|uniref:hypothetical protein n=1 Tax=Polaromonas sp. TaxID=1869339 RepID=UPI00184C40CF|nr:hypothetical protein [Polaromonas sp.]NMM10945.1 hypothetical protein [Polaromonas sp.]
MVGFILVGRSKLIAHQVLQSIRCFSTKKCVLVGHQETKILRWSLLVRQHFPIDLEGGDDQAFVKLVNSLPGITSETVLIPFDCDGIKMVRRVAHRLKMRISPVPDLPTLEMFDDKWTFHEFCGRNNLSTPPTIFIGAKSNLDFDKVITELGLPFILKPTNWSGSRGVYLMSSKKQFEKTVLNHADYDHGDLIAQKYIDGADIGFNLLAFNGRLSAFGIQQRRGPEMIFLPFPELEAMATKICLVSGYNGPMNVDARVDKETGKVFLLESNPRFWANTAASAFCGMNFVARCIGQDVSEQDVRTLVDGACNMRSPLLVPFLWGRMLFGKDQQSRLLRARALNPYAAGTLVKELSQAGIKFANRTRRN